VGIIGFGFGGLFALLLAKGKIPEEVVANMRSWKHLTFSVDQSVRLPFSHSVNCRLEKCMILNRSQCR